MSKKINKNTILLVFAYFTASVGVGTINLTNQANAARSIIFPVIGNSSYSNDYNAPRDGGSRTHHAIDIIANKGQKLVSAISGTIVDVQYPQPSWGYSATIQDSTGYKYRYIHMNDDNPGTNDGKGGGMNAYAVDIKEGNRVVQGQQLGWVGDSGKANGIAHLHFEMFNPKGTNVNPYLTLKRANKIKAPKSYPQLSSEILPSGGSFKSKVSVDVGNFDGDINPEIITAPGKGGRKVKIYETNKTKIIDFAPNASSFSGGYDVAAGNVDGDPEDEIITGAGPGGSFVKIFNTDGSLVGAFEPYGPNFKGGISVTAGNMDGDPEDEIITGAGKGGGPRVSIFDLNGTRLNTFYAYDVSFKGGIDVAGGDVTGSTQDEIVTAAGPGATSKVTLWEPNGTELWEIRTYSSNFRQGVRVSVGNIKTSSSKEEILTVPSTKASPLIKMFSGSSSQIGSYYFMEQWWQGYHDIGATNGISYASTGVNRRDSIRQGIR